MKKSGEVLNLSQPCNLARCGGADGRLAIEINGTAERVNIERRTAERGNRSDCSIAHNLLSFGNYLNARVPVRAKRKLLARNEILRRISCNASAGNLNLRRAAGNLIMRKTFAANKEILLILFVRRKSQ